MAVLAPIPNASDSTATALNTGAFFRFRRASRTSDARFTGVSLQGRYGDSAVQVPIFVHRLHPSESNSRPVRKGSPSAHDSDNESHRPQSSGRNRRPRVEL